MEMVEDGGDAGKSLRPEYLFGIEFAVGLPKLDMPFRRHGSQSYIARHDTPLLQTTCACIGTRHRKKRPPECRGLSDRAGTDAAGRSLCRERRPGCLRERA